MQTLPPPVDQLAGKTLGHYDVKQLLGYGNINAVYAARQQAQGRTVMLTAFVIPETFSPQARERFLTRFTQVASVLVRLDHPYILPTYDFGAQFGYPYLITPFVTGGGSLARILRQETRCTPERVLQILKQIAEGLEYAHQNGMIHGSLKPATILMDDEQNVHITGFGLTNILKMRGIEATNSQYAHLTSIAGTFLGAPEYIAPEVVQGAPADARSDVYSLGIMLFELLTGKLPFRGEDPFLVATQHVQHHVPPLQSLWPDALPGLDLVVQRAVDHDPAQRYQSVNRLITAFERVLTVIHSATSPKEAVKEIALPMNDLTMPPTVNWDEESFTDAKSSPLTGHIPTVTSPRAEVENWQLKPPIVTSQLAAIKANQMGRGQPAPYNAVSAPSPLRQPAIEEREQTKRPFDSFSLWTNASAPKIPTGGPGTFEETTNPSVKKATKRSAKKAANQSPREATKRSATNAPKARPTRKSRRRVIAMLATGGVAAGIIGAGGIGIAHFLQKGPAQQSNANHPTTSAQNAAANQQGNNGKQDNMAKQTTNTKQTPAKPAKQAAQNGTVIGKSSQASNSAQAFKNPADKNDSLLVRLPDGTFVAYESACTHQQVPVVYHPDTHTFICPLHGSIFDPAQNGKVLQGPAGTPLPAVKVNVNGDGTITAV